MDIESIRKDFPILENKANGKKLIYLDNAATSLRPKQVIDAELNYYNNCNANIHRGLHRMSEDASELYEEAHKKVASFVNAGPEEIIFTRNATESMNLIMYSFFASGYFKRGDNIVISLAEHHANILPWQFLERKAGVELRVCGFAKEFGLDYGMLESLVDGKTKLLGIAHAHNTIATINDVEKIGKMLKKKNKDSLYLVDAAQSVPHMPVDVRKINCDFLVFSGHKMLAPTGIGALYGKKELLEKMEPFLYGGDMIKDVKMHSAEWNDLPYKFEAGTPAIAQGIALGAAVGYLKKIGVNEVRKHEKQLTKIALEKLAGIKGITVYGPEDIEKRCGIVLFGHEKLSAHEMAGLLDKMHNIAIRSGMHCAQPMVESLDKKGLARASFYIYNTEEEIETFSEALKEVTTVFR